MSSQPKIPKRKSIRRGPSQSDYTVEMWLKSAVQLLKTAKVPTPSLDAEVILAHTLGKPRTYLHAHIEEFLTPRDLDIANARLDLRLDRVPIAYIIGHKEFYGHRFSVTTATLIPRPESETMIDLLREVVPQTASLLKETRRLVDVGTGSGALGIVAKLLFPELDVTLLDINRHALAVAEKNATYHNAKVRLLESDLLQNYPFQADYILANLPYVDKTWDRSPETNHEPPEALFADQNGLALIFKLLEQCGKVLSADGYLFIEADPEQHKSIIEHAKQQRLLLHSQRDYQLVFQPV